MATRPVSVSVGRASIYRTLELLTQLGLIRPIYLGENGPIYIHAEGGHHHLVCSTCGNVDTVDPCSTCSGDWALMSAA